MAFEQKPDTIILFPNDRRENDSSPHYKGSALIGGVEYWASEWDNTTREGKPMRKLALKKKEQLEMPVYKPKPMPMPDDDFDDRIPF